MGRAAYTKEYLHFLQAFRMFPLAIITAAFNNHFGTDKAVASIQSAYKNHHIRRGRKSPGKGNGLARVYTPDRVAWLRENYPLLQLAELTVAYNAAFGCDHTAKQLHSAMGRFNVHSGRDGCFIKGQNPWNKGVTGYMGANVTSFRKGRIPHTKKRLWSERVNKDGYIEISIPERNPWTGAPTRFKHKHLWIWEQEHGRLPKGRTVIFADGDNRNFASENLLCISRNELLVLNLHDYKNQPPELKPSILALARLEAKAGIRTVRAAGAGGKGRGKHETAIHPDHSPM